MTSLSEVAFRKAVTADAQQLIELRIKQLIDEGYTESRNIRPELNEYFETSLAGGSLICWVGTVRDNIIATGGLCFYQLPPSFSKPSGKMAYLTNMYTDDNYRRNGIAASLVDQLLIEAKAHDLKVVLLHASSDGKGVYEKAGFVDAGGYMALKM